MSRNHINVNRGVIRSKEHEKVCVNNFLFRRLVWKGATHSFIHITYLMGFYYESGTVSVIGGSGLNTGDQVPSVHFTEMSERAM